MGRVRCIDITTSCPRPLLRGWLHLGAALAMVPAALWLASQADGTARRASAVVFATAMFLVYAISGSYHVFARTPRAQSVMRRADHAAIYALIAATYTPVCVLAFPAPFGAFVLAGVWLTALAGITLALRWRARRAGAALFLALGWVPAAIAPVAWPDLPARVGLLLAAGGILYTVGAVLFFTRRPRLAPHLFGFHEVWHTFTLMAGAAHFVAIASLAA